ncbi:MAG: hypothetical protein NC293_01560 [Roseburia sp.]|nr:hypothetical protein [Roseburia sp.]
MKNCTDVKAKKILLCIGCSLIMLTGCGGEYASLTEGDVVSGSAVSGSAVSGGAVSEGAVNDKVAEPDAVSGSAVENAKQDMSSHRFCTDTNLYYMENCEDECSIMQARLDGTHRKLIKEWKEDEHEESNENIEGAELIYVDKSWLYYRLVHCFIHPEYNMYFYSYNITYRAPVKKDAKGYDVVDFAKAEEVVTSDYPRDFELIRRGYEIRPLYVDSDYYFYIDEVTKKLVKYDLKRKEKVSESAEGYKAESVSSVRNHYIMIIDDKIYSQKKDSGQWAKLTEYIEGPMMSYCDINPIEGDGEEIFYPQYLPEREDDPIFMVRKEGQDTWEELKHGARDLLGAFRFVIRRYDGETQQDFVTWEELIHVARKVAGVKKLDICQPYEIFVQDDRVYIQLLTCWMKEEIYHEEYMIFSKGKKEDDSGFRYEKELTECMKSHVKKQNEKNEGFDVKYDQPIVKNSAQCMAIVDGTAYLNLYDYKKDEGRIGCYDLSTGKFQWITDEDAVFYKLYYDRPWMDNDDDNWGDMLDYITDNFVEEFGYFIPTWADKESFLVRK